MKPGPLSDSPPSETAATLLPDGTVVIAQAVLPVWGRQLDVIHEQLNAGIVELTQAVAALMALQDELAAADPGDLSQKRGELLPQMQAQTEQALSGLQIGDRLSQMLAVVRGDIRRLLDEMPLLGESGQQRAQIWLDELRERYTTLEQHRVHDGLPTDDSTPPPQGVDFF